MKNRFHWSAHAINRFLVDVALLIPPMLIAVVALVVVELVALRYSGFSFVPRSSISKIGTIDFYLVGNGELGVSRISKQRAGIKYPLSWDILVHDLYDRQPPVQLNIGSFEPREMAASPTGDSFAIATQFGTVWVWDGLTIRGQRRMMSTTGTNEPSRLAYSPDGKFLVASGSQTVSVWRAASGELLQQLNHPFDSKGTLSFSSDSRKLLPSGHDNQLRLWDVQTGQLLKTVSVGEATLDSATISPDGMFAACISRLGPIFMVDLEMERILWQRPSTDFLTSTNLAFSCDGTLLATQFRNGKLSFGIRVWDTESENLVQELRGHECEVAGITFGPDDSLYSWDLHGITKRWDIKTARQTWQFSAFQWMSQSTTFL